MVSQLTLIPGRHRGDESLIGGLEMLLLFSTITVSWVVFMTVPERIHCRPCWLLLSIFTPLRFPKRSPPPPPEAGCMLR